MQAWTETRFILTDLEAKDSSEAITRLGNLLYQHGFVRDSFVPAVLEREKVFATGLPTPEYHVAIPHTDPEHVIHPAIAIAVLKKPVEFGEMGNPDARLDVHIVCMLAVRQSDSLVTILQNLVEMFQTPGLLEYVANSDPDTIANLFNQRLSIQEEA
jgi:PTS system galactitol-specific IIA component